MIEAAYTDLGLDWRYITLEVAPTDLGDAVAGVRALGFAGFNCASPHKVAVLRQLDEFGEIGATDTCGQLRGATRQPIDRRESGRGGLRGSTLISTKSEGSGGRHHRRRNVRGVATTDIVMNATSVGLHPNVDDRLPVDLGATSATTVVADVVFNPADTHLLRDARSRGCDTVDGVEMLVGQGVIGVEYWTGRSPDPDVIRGALAGTL